jgi:hypothetical protein
MRTIPEKKGLAAIAHSVISVPRSATSTAMITPVLRPGSGAMNRASSPADERQLLAWYFPPDLAQSPP